MNKEEKSYLYTEGEQNAIILIIYIYNYIYHLIIGVNILDEINMR